MPSPEQVREHLPQQEIHADVGSVTSDNTPSKPVKPVKPGNITSLLVGFVILLFILLLCAIYFVAPYIDGTGQAAGSSSASAVPASDSDNSVLPLPQTTPLTPVVTPVIISSAPTPKPPAVLPSAPRSYVTIEAVPVTISPPLQDLTSDMPVPDTTNYFTIYSMSGQQAQQNLPYVSCRLVNPPLVIDYTITPMTVIDIKDVVYKIINTTYNEQLTINRPSEQSWFRVVVRDRDTGRVVLEDGYGKTFGQVKSGHIALYKSGNYRFEFTGGYATIDLTMKVKKERNIE